MSESRPSGLGCISAIMLYVLVLIYFMPLTALTFDYYHHLWCGEHPCADKFTFLNWPKPKAQAATERLP